MFNVHGFVHHNNIIIKRISKILLSAANTQHKLLPIQTIKTTDILYKYTPELL
jgi:hypothetical protein